MPRRRRIPPNPKALDWRDPNMPVERPMEDNWGRRFVARISPEAEQQFCKEKMAYLPAPSWRDDPTYNLARPGARRRS